MQMGELLLVSSWCCFAIGVLVGALTYAYDTWQGWRTVEKETPDDA